MKEDAFFLGQIADKIARCENKYITTYTNFMDGHQQSVARIHCRKNFIPVMEMGLNTATDIHSVLTFRSIFYGGYPDAERVILINLPDYAVLEDEQPLVLIRAVKAEGSGELTHRDYLGALLGLGIKRELIGDILVREDGADIICMREIADFLLMNYCKARRTDLSLERRDIKELIVPPVKLRCITDTVASLRLDSLVAAAFGLSRGKAGQSIARGMVFVNHMEIMKPDYQVTEGDRITLRGKGKAVLAEIGGKSRKDRQYIKIERY